MEKSLTCLYTYNLMGELNRLPRLYNWLQQLRGDDLTFIVDLGNACVADVWPCGVTGGRSTLMVLDAMGYTAANVVGTLDMTMYEKTIEQLLMMLIIDDTQPISVTSDLQISLKPAQFTHIEGNTLYLAPVETLEVGVVRLNHGLIQSTERAMLPAATLPDATIAGVVDFVVSEARYYESAK